MNEQHWNDVLESLPRDRFESVLRDRFALDPIACRDELEWCFEVEGVCLRATIRNFDIRVQTAICSISESADFDALDADIDNATAPGSACFQAAVDLLAMATTTRDEATPERIEAMIRDCVAAAKSPAASSLRSRWQAG